MSDLHQQLAILRERMARASASAVANPARALPQSEIAAEPVEGREVATSAGAHLESDRVWAGHERHGSMEIADLLDLPGDVLEAISGGECRGVDPCRVAYLDTETTGLAGGSGTYAFLVGVGCVGAEGFKLRHFFMRDYSEEASQLTALAEYLESFDTLVTYNGRAYDVPLLETRYRMCRQRPPFSRMRHLDLLYGARRLYKLAFANCRLVELESQVLGFQREGDVPGSLIPEMYFEYIRTRRAHRIGAVFTHNAWDILTLACLTGIVPRAFHDPLGVPLRRGEEMVGVARWLAAAGRDAEAATLFRRALRSALPEDLCWRTIWDCSLLERRLGQTAAAIELWTELTTMRNPHQAAALEELAKFQEHTGKNPVLALDYTERALRLGTTASLEKRRQRLMRRLQPRLL